MKKTFLTSSLFILFFTFTFAQTPEVTSWVINPGTDTGYSGILCNVQKVQYSANYVYITCASIPSYTIGPWFGNPNVAKDQGFLFKITRSPQKNSGTATVVGLGHTGVWSNGVSIFNSSDGMSYNNDLVWHRNAYYFESVSFDNCGGHPQQQGEYHHHISPKCLYNEQDSTKHSPIIGYMFDGFPVYGAYAYADTNGTGGIKRMRSSYQTRNITTRTTLPNGDTTLSAGPAVGGQYPIGAFLEDYVYTPGSGDLDANNGRFCTTPEYPGGIYAYFVTIDSAFNPVYPYTPNNNYYGVVTQGNTGPNGGKNTISEPVTTYTPVATAVTETEANIKYYIYPNPVKDYAFIYVDANSPDNITGALYNDNGQLLQTIYNLHPGTNCKLNMAAYPAGIYILHLGTGLQTVKQKILKIE